MISNTVATAMLQLAAALRDEGELRDGPEVNQTLLQLVRDAYDVLVNPSTPVDLKDWVKAAEPFIKEDER